MKSVHRFVPNTRVGEVWINLATGEIDGNFDPGPDAQKSLVIAFSRILAELRDLPAGASYLDYDEGKVSIGS